ncbi:MAG: peptidoglycan DD-metalloendopeptidase family protein, partial [Pseudomonadota bacterium]
ESINKNLQQEEGKKKKLETTVKSLEKDLRITKEKLVELGGSIQGNEQKLTNIQERIKDKEIEKLKIQQKLEKDHKYIARLVLALQRIRRIPPEALIVKPGAPLETAQSAMLLGDILPSIHKDAQKLKENIQALEDISNDLKNEKQRVVSTSKKLSEKHEQLSQLTEKRQSLYRRTHKDLKEQEEQVQKISTQVKSLNELIKRLEEENKRKAKEKKTQPKKRNVKLASVTRAVPGSNNSQLPASGLIQTNFNEADSFGAPSKGIEISANSGALVVAPLEGTIRFAGPFKNYRNLIIIEHDSGYHSLIARGLMNGMAYHVRQIARFGPTAIATIPMRMKERFSPVSCQPNAARLRKKETSLTARSAR